jgi:hypothetical protein
VSGARRSPPRAARAAAPPAASAAVEFPVATAADGDGWIEPTGLPPGPWRVRLDRTATPGAADVEEAADFTDLRL